MLQILNRWTKAAVYSGEALSMCALTERAVEGGANLGGADLRGANLGDADLRDANLRGADLGDANLRGANLRGADLGDANLRGANLGGADLGGADLGGADLRDADLGGADLRDADLRDANLRGADLGDANLRGANLGGADLGDANLRGANLGGADLGGADLGDLSSFAPEVPDLDLHMEEVTRPDGALNMGQWHCGSTHCRSGWAITLAGRPGASLERLLGPALAGALIYHRSTGHIPNFYADNETARADIVARADEARAAKVVSDGQ